MAEGSVGHRTGRWEEKNAQRIKDGLLPMTRHSVMIADSALDTNASGSTAPTTHSLSPCLRQYQHQSPPYPFLHHHQLPASPASPPSTSTAATPKCWHFSSSGLSNKTTKMPQQYRRPTQLKKDLPKGWVYIEDNEEVKTEGFNPSTYKLSTRPLTQAQHRQQRGPSRAIPAPVGYEHNRGVAYVPFNILNNYGRTPARYIQVHMTDNPYVIGRLSFNGPDYWGELHAATVNDLDTPTPHLNEEAMRMLSRHYPAATFVNNALAQEADRGLTAEVRRWRGYERRLEVNAEEQKQLEREEYHMRLEQGLCRHRMQEAQGINQIVR